MESPYLKESKAAEILKCSVQTLRNHRHQNKGLPYTKHVRTVLYDLDDIKQYLASRKVTPAER